MDQSAIRTNGTSDLGQDRPDSTAAILLDSMIIDLRDPGVADGLAHALTQVAALSERTGAAEARAEIARHERMTASGQVRRLTADIENEQAARHRLEIDNAELRRENELRREQLGQAVGELNDVRQHFRVAMAAADGEIERLRAELAGALRSISLLEAMVTNRKRRRYLRIVSDDGAAADPVEAE